MLKSRLRCIRSAHMRVAGCLIALTVLSFCNGLAAQEKSSAKAKQRAVDKTTGTLKVKFLWSKKKLPKPRLLAGLKQNCANLNVIDKQLIVGEKGGIANVVVFIRDANVPIIKPAKAAAKKPVVLDNVKCLFQPRISLVQTGQPLDLGNLDAFAHNVKAEPFNNPGFNVLIPGKQRIMRPGFANPERLPVKVSCNIHPHMASWMVVCPHPYMAVSNKKGELLLEHLPPGEWEFQFWHEVCGYLSEYANAPKRRRGRMKIVIQAGKTADLGVLKPIIQ